MATTKVKSIKTRLDRTIKYILNPSKTENQLYTGGFNCVPRNASQLMNDTKSRFHKKDGRLGYHLIQSFMPGEATPELAFNIASEFALQYLSNKYEVVFSTHVDREHIHNHIVWNSVSCVDGYKYHADKNEYSDRIRKISDGLCKDNNLSVIVPGESGSVNKHYSEWLAVKQGKTTWRDIIRSDIDKAIEISYDLGTFLYQLNEMGYLYKRGQYISVKCDGMERYVRLKSLGKGYTDYDIKSRLAGQEVMQSAYNFQKFAERVYIPPTPKKLKGFQALVWHYKYLLGQVKKNEHIIPMSDQMKKDLIVFDKITAIYNVMTEYDIKDVSDIEPAKEIIVSEMQKLMEHRKTIPVQNRDVINIKIRLLRKELHTVSTLKEEVPRIKKIIEPVTLVRKEKNRELER